jgi:hypothetical protein
MPMFPDSGVPAGDAKYSLPFVDTATPCDELWYSTSRCQPRFDPAAANAMLAEDMNLIMKGEVQYDCERLDHIERAVRYINQRGLPRACALTAGPLDFAGVLDPAITRHSDMMTLTIIPNVDNQALVRLNFGLGLIPLLRNDGTQMRSQDLKTGKPAIIAFWQGNWYMCGLVASQVPLLGTGSVDGWIRTDGNDVTGDGTANTPDKAFRTIAGAWNALSNRYAASPGFSINLKLGIPGNYEGTMIGPYGGQCSLVGDVNSPAAYRVVSPASAYDTSGFGVNAASTLVAGCNFVQNQSNLMPNFAAALRVYRGNVWADRCQFTAEASNANSALIMLGTNSNLAIVGSHILEGNGCSIGHGMWIYNSAFGGAPPEANAGWHWRNINFTRSGHYLINFSLAANGNFSMTDSGCTGIKYDVTLNSVLMTYGQIVPGNVAGTTSLQGQVI